MATFPGFYNRLIELNSPIIYDFAFQQFLKCTEPLPPWNRSIVKLRKSSLVLKLLWFFGSVRPWMSRAIIANTSRMGYAIAHHQTCHLQIYLYTWGLKIFFWGCRYLIWNILSTKITVYMQKPRIMKSFLRCRVNALCTRLRNRSVIQK